MGKIKELPKLDRPREKALRYGVNTLSDIELLTLLISSGYQGVNALEIATNLISEFNGLYNLSKAEIFELEKVKGIKDAKALNLSAIFELHKRLLTKETENVENVEVNAEYLYNKYKATLKSNHQEHLILIILNQSRKVIHEKTLYVGTEKNMCYSYRDIWRELYNHHGQYFYLIHNHPGHSSSPSKEDIIFTSELVIQSERLKTPMIDHLIIGENGYYSFQNMKK